MFGFNVAFNHLHRFYHKYQERKKHCENVPKLNYKQGKHVGGFEIKELKLVEMNLI